MIWVITAHKLCVYHSDSLKCVLGPIFPVSNGPELFHTRSTARAVNIVPIARTLDPSGFLGKISVLKWQAVGLKGQRRRNEGHAIEWRQTLGAGFVPSLSFTLAPSISLRRYSPVLDSLLHSVSFRRVNHPPSSRPLHRVETIASEDVFLIDIVIGRFGCCLQMAN